MKDVKKIVVTGATGFIGGYVCKSLSNTDDIQIYACVRNSKDFVFDVAINLEVDFLNEGFERLIASVKPDIIVHTAALSQVDYCELNRDEAWKVNVAATEKIAFVAKEVNARLIFLSSDFVFSGENEFEIIKRAFKNGANGFLTKSVTRKRLQYALHSIKNEGAALSNDVAKKIISTFQTKSYQSFSERENQIIDHLSQGATYKIIAEKLFVTTSAINFHIQNIYLKLNVNSKSETLMKLQERG